MDLNMYRMERAVSRLSERVFYVFRAVQEGALKLKKRVLYCGVSCARVGTTGKGRRLYSA